MKVEDNGLRVTWPDDLEGNKELFAGLQTANNVLEEELGRSKGLVTADWKLLQDSQNRTLLELTLTDRFTRSQVTEKFAPDELRNRTQLESRLHRLWGRLLNARFDVQVKRSRELASQAEGE